MKDIKKYLKEYCVGCGVCQYKEKSNVVKNVKGFISPISGETKWLEKICPAGGQQSRYFDGDKVWGRYNSVYYGWSTDSHVRKLASSGGVITEIASYLLQKKIVDAVIHTGADNDNPTQTITVFSTNRDELINRCGSRYAISSPLDFFSKIDIRKKYAFIGKPCDINVLSNLIKTEPKIKDNIVMTLSFFCAGLPSTEAQIKLLKELKCNNCISLKYRGNGWPGNTTAVDSNGVSHEMDYDSSWGRILGRDIMPMCRLCLDGVGELADIACGDAWYLTNELTPDFSERDGRNVIFARTELGEQILSGMAKDGCIYIENSSIDELKYIQKFQYERRTTMLVKIIAMFLTFKSIPRYPFKLLIKYSKHGNRQVKKDVFIGTFIRSVKGNI